MAQFFPQIEVFTTESERLWSQDWIKRTPSKFAKELKVLDLTNIPHGYGDRECAVLNAVIDKLEADGVVHIRLLSLPNLKEDVIGKILSRVTVDHLVFEDTWDRSSTFFDDGGVYSICVDDVYSICAQINAMHVQNAMHIYFPSARIFLVSAGIDPCRPFRLILSRDYSSAPIEKLNVERFCLNLRFNRLHRDVRSAQEAPSDSRLPIEGDVDMCSLLTVHLPEHSDVDVDHSWIKSITKYGDISLEDFPHIKVNLDLPRPSAHPFSIRYLCNALQITAEHEWPIKNPLWLPTYEFSRDSGSTCFDSRIESGRDRTSLYDVINIDTMLNLKESQRKTSPHHVVTVALLDTGVRACDEQLVDKIVAVKNFVPENPLEASDLCYDASGHGTSCASTLLQTAPFVRLVVCKVLSSRGHGQLKWAADAVDWLLNSEDGPKNYCPVDVISMSFGGDSFDNDLRRTISDAVAHGKVVVAAASNDGRKKVTNIAFPARFGDVICVGSCNNLGQPSSFTPTGREIDFLAPGEDIPDLSSLRRSGTSEATPIVAGIAAMVISYAETTGGQTMRSAVCNTAVMREILRKMASMPGHHDEHMGYGNLDPWRLFKYGQDHFRQVVEEVVGPLPVLHPRNREVETQTDEMSC